ncbi:RHS repeat-associated core domain-containing protein, partial [Pseudomonas fluorescens]|uniref:RHS repeat-associated core domain-containing protein n=1 Tax=Pseudomonas fluorescens TaxID=294 RepID=UPI0035247536
YDPVGRLLSATTRQGVETFAFDPAGNLLDDKATEIRRPLDLTPPRSKLVDNLLREYAGTHYDYDERGNQIQRWHNGQRSDLRWDLFDRLVHFEDPRLSVDFAYDALGRRLHKNSRAHYKQRPEAGSLWNRNEHARKQRELGCGFTLYGWDGDNLAWESSPAQSDGEAGRTVHYVFEPGTFVPVAQAVRYAPIDLIGLPDYSGEYSLDDDPVWNHKATALPFDALAWYQCDHLGTPQELTDSQGNMAWTAQYKAWGQVTEQRSEWARQHGVMNPIRFQGQYHDHETGLHYNRYRYYDPQTGRFVSRDPISFGGGMNFYQYASNPVIWTDPLGLAADGQLGTYGSMNGGSNVGDQLEVHELVRHESLVQMGCANKRRRNKANPSIAVDPTRHDAIHSNETTLARTHLGLGVNEFDFDPATGKPSKRQMDVWQGAIRQSGISASQARRLRKRSGQYVNSLNCCCD